MVSVVGRVMSYDFKQQSQGIVGVALFQVAFCEVCMKCGCVFQLNLWVALHWRIVKF